MVSDATIGGIIDKLMDIEVAGDGLLNQMIDATESNMDSDAADVSVDQSEVQALVNKAQKGELTQDDLKNAEIDTEGFTADYKLTQAGIDAMCSKIANHYGRLYVHGKIPTADGAAAIMAVEDLKGGWENSVGLMTGSAKSGQNMARIADRKLA